MLRAIREIQPTWVVGENVRGLTNWNGGLVFDEVQADLEALGYEVTPFLLPACAVNAPHRRDRIWFVAYNNNGNRQEIGLQAGGEINVDGIEGTRTSPNTGLFGQEINEQQAAGIEQCDKRDATDTDSRGLERSTEIGRDCEYVIRESEFRTTPDTTSQSSEWLRSEQREYSEQEQRQFGRNDSEVGSRNVTNTQSTGLERKDESECCEGRKWMQVRGNTTGYGSSNVVTDTSNKGLQRSEKYRSIGEGRKDKNQFFTGCVPSNWRNFPTQSPICSRNDGIFTKSHGIAISENRNNMDRNLVTKLCLEEGRLKVDFKTGKVYSLKQRGKEGQKIELNGSDCNGYIVHGIRYNGFKIQLRAHQIVWIAANGLYDKQTLMIDHINRDKKDNRLSNLRLVDAKGNRENATEYKGKLSDEQKDMMTWLHKEDKIPMRELAEDFGISKSRVQQIISEHSGLYGITFPKWRNESIKAAGNAIVPQVVYQIFKAIQQYELTLNK